MGVLDGLGKIFDEIGSRGLSDLSLYLDVEALTSGGLVEALGRDVVWVLGSFLLARPWRLFDLLVWISRGSQIFIFQDWIHIFGYL